MAPGGRKSTVLVVSHQYILIIHLFIYITVSCSGGGCMFCYIENNAEKIDAVKRAIEGLGANAYVITIDEGTK